jgi:integrase
MPKVSLTDRFVATVRAKGATPHDYFDKSTPGLGLRVSPQGHKAWSLIFTSPATGKRARLSLGSYPATPLVEARTRAIEAKGKVEAGTDPRDSGTPSSIYKSDAMTVSDLVSNYLDLHARDLRSLGEIRRRLELDVLPTIGPVELDKLHRRDILRALDPIVQRGAPATARRVYTDLKSMIRFAVGRDVLDQDIMAGMKSPAAAKPRDRILDEDEIRSLWQAWPAALSDEIALALKLALVTGQRIGEVVGMDASEINLAKAIWKIPAERAKNGFAHDVPLSQLALDLIQGIEPRYNGRLFAAGVVDVGQAINRRRDRLPELRHWTAHDLRRTVCTHLAMLGIPPMVIGAVVNHRGTTKAGITLSTYVHYSYDREKREALELWAERLGAIVAGTGAKVQPLRKVRA